MKKLQCIIAFHSELFDCMSVWKKIESLYFFLLLLWATTTNMRNQIFFLENNFLLISFCRVGNEVAFNPDFLVTAFFLQENLLP